MDIKDAVFAATQNYSKLVLIVGLPKSGKTSLLSSYASSLGTSVINVNMYLAERLLELNKRERTTHVHQILSQLKADANNPLLLDNTEILFDRHLALDPIRLLQQLARNQAVVASWGGRILDGKLTYATSSHPEFVSKNEDEVDAVIINMEGL